MKLKVIYNKFIFGLKGAISFIRHFSLAKLVDVKGTVIKKIPSALLSKRTIVFGVVLVTVIAIGYANSFKKLLPFYTEEVADYGGVYSEAVIGKFFQFNPLFSQKNPPDSDLVSLVYSGLIKFDAKGVPVSDLAESWEIDSAGKIYTIRLKKGVVWHDGQPFTAEDVIYTFTKITDPNVKSPLYTEWQNVRVEKKNDTTILFRLPNPYAPFLSLLDQPIIAQHIYSVVPDRNLSISELNQSPVGTGPFVFDSRRTVGNSEEITLQRNEKYHGKRAYLERVVLKSYVGGAEAVDAYANKQVNGVSEIAPAEAAKASNFSSLLIRKHNTGRVLTMFINTKSEMLASLAMRKAVLAATDKTKILNEAFGGQGRVVNRLIPTGYAGSKPDDGKSAYDTKTASSILESAGWVRNEQGLLTKKGRVLILRIVALRSPEIQKTVDLLSAELTSLGIQTDVHTEDLNNLDAKYLRNRNFDLFIITDSVGYETDPYPRWHSSQITSPGLNFSSFSDQDADRALEGARRIRDRSQRSQKLIDFEKILLEKIPAVFVLSPYYLHGTDDSVHIPDNLTQTVIVESKDRFRNIESWYISTKQVERRILTRIK